MKKEYVDYWYCCFCFWQWAVMGKEEESEEPLVVAMELAYPPFEMKDEAGEPAGVSVDLMKAFW